MKFWARILDNTVMEIISHDPVGLYHSSLVWVECDEAVKEGMIYGFETGIFSDAPAPVIPVKTQKLIINVERADAKKQGMEYTFPDGLTGVANVEETEHLVNIMAIGLGAMYATISNDPSAKFYFRDKKDQTHEMLTAEAILFVLTFFGWWTGIYQQSWDKKDALK